MPGLHRMQQAASAVSTSLFYDTFTDTNSTALASHTPDIDQVGNGWTELNGSWIISSNKAAPTGTPPGQPVFVAVMESYQADATITCTVNSPNENGTHGIVFRRNPITGTFFLVALATNTDRFRLFYWNGSTFDLLVNADEAIEPDTDYVMQVVLSGTSIIVNLDGVEKINTTSASNQLATQHGIRAASALPTFDDFTVEGTANLFDDVFLVAGQSNAAGHLTNTQTYNGTRPMFVFDQDDYAIRTLADPTDSGVAFGSVWPLLANLISANLGRRVLFITAADGGTGLVTPDTNWAKGGTQYNNALAQLGYAGVQNLTAVLWYQGERDVVNGISAAAYQTALSQMIDDIQADTGFSSVKLIAALIGEYSTQTDASINAIRTAIINRWVNDADILPGPTAHDQTFADGLHWATDAEGQTLANRWYRVLDAHIYGGAEAARGPQFSSATRSGTTVTVTFTGGEGNLQNQTDTTGWKFTDNGTPITINSAAANGTNAVDLTLASTPSGTELISFSQGNDIGTTLSDSGTYPLPPEPFVDEAVA